MPSIIEGYNYDIFISYRQKDNKGDRWVSEFVDALKTELDATFKDDISIYFDENPHDGLLETDDVDLSLKEKLKCVVFIPIISRTFCDPKAFAWKHEFLAFIDLASSDKIGLKVSLPNGNVATRVLPVRIYELDPADIQMCEAAIGSSLRGVDFIYKSPGVNRPLLRNEDNPKDNLNKTYYRDQVNKVANAIDGILKGLHRDIINKEERMDEAFSDDHISKTKDSSLIERIFFSQNRKRYSRILISSTLFLIGLLLVFRLIYLPYYGNTVAILPFAINKDSSLTAIGDTLMVDMYNQLRGARGITVRSILVSFKYRNTTMRFQELRKELRANYLIFGSLTPVSGKLKITIELVKARNNTARFSRDYRKEKYEIYLLGKEIALNISDELNSWHDDAEKIKKTEISTSKPYAYLNTKAGNSISDNTWFYYQYGNKYMDSSSFQQAISRYDDAIKLDPLYALAYAKRSIARSRGFYARQLDSTHIEKSLDDIKTAQKIDSTIAEIQNALGFYYYYCKKKPETAIQYFQNAAELEPGNYEPLFYLAVVYRRLGEWAKSQELINRVVKFDLSDALYLTNIGLSYTYLHKYDSALIFHQKAIDAMPQWPAPYKNMIETILLNNGNVHDAKNIIEMAIIKTNENMSEQKIMLSIYEGNYLEAMEIARQTDKRYFKAIGSKYILMALISSYLNRPGDAVKYYDTSLVVLKNDLLKEPDNENTRGYIGIALAGKGNKVEAVTEGLNAVKMAGQDGLSSGDMKINMAIIFVLVGDYENAIKLVEELLEKPSNLSAELLKIDPVWKPLASVPEFHSLISKYSRN